MSSLSLSHDLAAFSVSCDLSQWMGDEDNEPAWFRSVRFDWMQYTNEIQQKCKGELIYREEKSAVCHLIPTCSVVQDKSKLCQEILDDLRGWFICPACAALISRDPFHETYRRAVRRRLNITLGYLVRRQITDIEVFAGSRSFHLTKHCPNVITTTEKPAKSIELGLFEEPIQTKMKRSRNRHRRNGNTNIGKRRGSKKMASSWSIPKGFAKSQRLKRLPICQFCYDAIWQLSTDGTGETSTIAHFADVFPLLAGAVLENVLPDHFLQHVETEMTTRRRNE